MTRTLRQPDAAQQLRRPFALRRPEQDRGSGMIVGLSILTAAILVQGWFGGALVHGVDHLNW